MNEKDTNSSTKLALYGGEPVRQNVLPYGTQYIDDADIQAVTDVLQGNWLTTGPTVDQFEKAFAAFVGAKHAVAVSNGTAALHAAIYAMGIEAGDEVIVTPMTFAASANCIVYQGGTPVFADVDAQSLLIDPEKIKEKITERTRAIVAVDYTGQACDYDALLQIANEHNLIVLDDACHAIGGTYKGRPVGTLAHLNTFSLHPVKHLTTGEGGVITTDDDTFAERMRLFRNHGITTDHRQRAEQGGFFYEMVDLGYNYRLTDIQCALGISQLKKLPDFVEKRRAIAKRYDEAFAQIEYVHPLGVRDEVTHAYHIYVVQFDLDSLGVDRQTIYEALRAENIGVNVHYIPVHYHPYYRQTFGTGEGLCPVAEAAYERILTLPIFPMMEAADVDDVIEAIKKLSSL
ncbi:DegT/DnrJ/EryC1/StrS family aminotransferase [Anaerolineales bacterium]